MKQIIWALLCAALPVSAQVVVGNYPVQYVGSAPSGSCGSNAPLTVVVPIGTVYTCQSGTWGIISGGGGGSGTVIGQSNGVIPLGSSSTVIGQQSHCNDGLTTGGFITCSEPLSATSLSSCLSGVCLSFTPSSTPIENVNLNWANGYIGLLKTLHGQFQVSGSDCATDSAACNYSASVTPDPGDIIGTPIKSGNNFAIEFPTPTSQSSLTAAWGSGLVSIMVANGLTTFNNIGDSWTNLGTNSANGLSATDPVTINSVSGAVSGNAAGWDGNQIYWSAGQPIVKTWFRYPATGDFSAVRTYIGLCNSCTSTNLNSDTPNPGIMAMIRYSTVAGDSTWMCYTSDGTTASATAIPSATPSITGAVFEIDVNASSVVCKVGSNSVSKATNLPVTSPNTMQWWIASITQAAAAVNCRTSGAYGRYQNRNN